MDQIEVRSLSAGRNQQAVRQHNERLILSTLQRHGALPGSDIARLTGLSPQTVSVILRGLENDGLLARGAPQRGKVGKPSVPMELAEEGAFSVGLKIGRRSADLVLTDFLGQTREHLQMTYRYPMPATIQKFLESGLSTFEAAVPAEAFRRIAGIGIAKPFEIWNWHSTIGAPAEALGAWKDLKFEEEISRFTSLPVFVENDATAACRAEHIYGRGREFRNYAYFFIGSFIGGGVVLNNSVFEGASGNAGAFGSLPVLGPDGTEMQLIDAASLYLLEEEIAQAGFDPTRIWAEDQDWSEFPAILDAWISRTAIQLARSAVTICSVIDFEAVLIDGGFPVEVRRRLVDQTAIEIQGVESPGIVRPQIVAGTVGRNARALGAASAPITAQFFLNTHGEPAGN